MLIQIDHPKAGLATVALGNGRRLTYLCDARAHRINVTDDFGHSLFAFGGFGSQPGAFNTPLDIAFVRPEFAGESVPVVGPDAVWLAVADYGNRRVQILELDGAHVATLELEQRFAIGPPCSLQWRAPMLEVHGVEGARTEVHLTAALLCASPLPRTTTPAPREWANQRTWVH